MLLEKLVNATTPSLISFQLFSKFLGGSATRSTSLATTMTLLMELASGTMSM